MSRRYDEDMDCYVESAPTDASEQRAYFLGRLETVDCEVDSKLRRQFGLTDDERPQSFTEFLARITSGKYVYPDDKKDSRWYMDYIEWRDPSVKKDQAGYDAARKSFESAKYKVKDTIMSAPATDAAAAVQALETWTPTGAAN